MHNTKLPIYYLVTHYRPVGGRSARVIKFGMNSHRDTQTGDENTATLE